MALDLDSFEHGPVQVEFRHDMMQHIEIPRAVSLAAKHDGQKIGENPPNQHPPSTHFRFETLGSVKQWMTSLTGREVYVKRAREGLYLQSPPLNPRPGPDVPGLEVWVSPA